MSTVSYSLGTAGRCMAKMEKSKGILLKGVNDVPLPDDANTMLIQDGKTLFHAMTDIPNNFQLISHRIFENMPKRINFILSTGMYQEGSITGMYQEGSIKDMERDQHGSSKKLITGGQLTKMPADWKM